MEPNAIADLIDRVTTGEPWHASSVRETLAGVTAAQAATAGPGGANSIWALVLHMTAWAREVKARLGGRPAQDPDKGDYPPIGEPTDARWQAAQAALFAAHEELAAAIRRVEPATLAAPVLDYREGREGAGLSHYVTLHGLVHHTVYHAGQIAILKRALG